MAKRCFELKLIKQVLIWLGMSPPKLNPRTNYSYLLPMFIHFTIYFLVAHTVLAHPERFFQTTSTVKYFLDFVHAFRVLFAAAAQILENILKTHVEDELNESIEAIDDEIFAKHLCSNSKRCSFCRKRSLKFFFYSRIALFPVTCFMVDLTLMNLVSETDKTWANSLFIREFSSSMVRIGMIQIVCHFYWVCASVVFHLLNK